MDEDTSERELAMVGDIGAGQVRRDEVRFATDDAAGLAAWLRDHGDDLPMAVFSAVDAVERDGDGVIVRSDLARNRTINAKLDGKSSVTCTA